MSFRSLVSQNLKLYRRIPGTPDRLANPTDALADPVDVKGRIEQISSQEVAVGEDVVIADWRVFLLPDVALGPFDRIGDVSGRKFEVVGLPDVCYGARAPHHIEAHLRTVLSG